MAEQKISLTEEFNLLVDSSGNHWLTQNRINKKTGKAYTTEHYCGYHRTFARLFESFVPTRISDKEASTVKKLLRNISEVETEVRELAHSIGQALDERRLK